MLEYQRPRTELTLGNGLSEYYSSHDGLVGGRGASPGAREFFRCLFPLVLWRCSRMRRRWPWLDLERYRGVPLSGIRSKYGIRLVSGGERT